MHYVVIYHDPCCDGFTARWMATRMFRDNNHTYELIPVNYTQDYSKIPDIIKDKHVLVFDFSFDRELMEQLNEVAESFKVFDHHKTAIEACKDLPYCTFDLNKSGAMLAWEYLYQRHAVPALVQYVQDYDLWKFLLPDSKAINAAIHAREKTEENWELLYNQLEDGPARQKLVDEGNTILALEEIQIANAVKNATTIVIKGYRVPLINNPNLISKTVERLCIDQPFAASFFMRPDGHFVFSLRSRKPNGIDVSEVAKGFPGGGGHAQAAGFTVDFKTFEILHSTVEEVGKV